MHAVPVLEREYRKGDERSLHPLVVKKHRCPQYFVMSREIVMYMLPDQRSSMRFGMRRDPHEFKKLDGIQLSQMANTSTGFVQKDNVFVDIKK